VHDPTRFNSILRVPAYGVITLDRWVQVITGYVVFFVFGTGNDAHNTYKAMLLAVGLSRVFPGLHIRNDSGSASPTSFIAARTWTSSLSRKAKSMFSSVTTGSSAADTTMGGTIRNNSVVLGSMCHVRPVSTGETVLKMQPSNQSHPTNGLSFFARLFTRPNRSASVLPLYSHSSATKLTFTTTHMSSANDSPLAYNFKATAWAATPGSSTEADGVRVLREVHQDSEDRAFAAKEKMSSEDWA
jgi:pheromone a factor receptor